MKTCVITGASQGIGRATAIRLSQSPEIDGFALVARNEQGLEETRALMEQEGNTIRAFPFDLSDLHAIPGLVKEIQDEFDGIDLLLNVAGYADPRALADTSIDNLINTYTINVFAVFVLIRECAKSMAHRGAKILNVASTAGFTPRPGWLAYASSKAAVLSMSNTLSDELTEYGIKVYTISPGRCATELRHKLAPEEDPSMIMQPEHVASVIATLMNNEETCLDGQNIIVRQQVHC